MKSTRHVVLLLIILMFSTACQPLRSLIGMEPLPEPVEQEPFYTLDGDVEEGHAIGEWLAPYREILKRELDIRIAVTSGPLELQMEGEPGSPLGYLAADMIRFRAAHITREFVHLGLINSEVLRIEFSAGDITIEDLHELMPSDQTLVILKVTGEQVTRLAEEIAQKGGAPVSGMRMAILNSEPRGVLVNAGIVDPEGIYSIATTNVLANGGGFVSIIDPLERIDYPVLIRDVFISYLQDRRFIDPVFDHRIRAL